MSRIPDETIQQVRDRVDIVELIGRYVTLRQAGRNFKGLCPFHNEKTPSFNVNVDRQIFHCFGCGEGGNAISFLMRHENLTFPETVRLLADEYGIAVPESSNREQGISEQLFKINQIAQDTYRSILGASQGSVAREYLSNRGISTEIIEKFGLGFVPDRWDTIAKALNKAKVSPEDGEKAGLLARSDKGRVYDRLRGRVTFPIQDVRGRIVGFGGRTLGKEDGAKYLNSPESPIYRKREAFYGFPYALESIRRGGRVVIVEGYFDLLAMHRAGIGETLATCGTALTPEHGRNLRRRVKEVILLFDGDEAGQRAAMKGLESLLPDGLRVRAAVLPGGSDPDDFLNENGAEELKRLIDEAPMALDMVTRRVLAKGCSAPWEKADAVKEVAPFIGLVPDSLERDEFVRRFALALDAKEELIANEIQAVRSDSPRNQEIENVKPVVRPASDEGRYARDLATYLIARPEEARQLEAIDLDELIVDETWKSVLRTIECWYMEGNSDLLEAAETLPVEARNLLSEIATQSSPPLDAKEISIAVSDVIQRLRERRVKTERRAATRKFLEDPQSSAKSLLEVKQQQLEEKRASLGLGERSHHGGGGSRSD